MEHFRVVTSSVMRQRSLKWIEQQNVSNGLIAYVTDISSSLGCIAVQGPRSRDTLQKICDFDLKALKFFRFIPAKLAGIPAIVSRVGFTGELGFECYFDAEDAVQAWHAIIEAGEEYEILPYGLDVLDTLRYEKGFIFFGYEVTEENNPFECGLEKWIRFEKPSFLGKSALLRIRESGPKQRLVALEGKELEKIERSLDVKYRDQKVGETLLGFHGITVGKDIAWAFVNSKNVDYGLRVTIATKKGDMEATMIDIRCYDPMGERMKM